MTTSKNQNPILKGFNPDPSIVRVGEDYYVATSTFEWYPGVQIHHSRDLVNWRVVAQPLNRADLLDLTGNPDSCGVWAPCLSYDDGLFYLIYTDVKRHCSSFKDAHNYLTTCPSIDGSWSPRIYLNSSGFDPSLFHDDGRKWLLNMVWDHRPGKNPFGGIYLQEYDHRAGVLKGPVTNIFKGTSQGLTEAPHIYKRNGYYYLVTAEGGTEYEHCMVFARSRSITGPYEIDPHGYFLTSKDDTALPLQRSGHGDIVETLEGDTYVVHLSSRPLPGTRRSPMGRETAIQMALWGADDWLRLADGGNKPNLVLPAVNLPLHPWPRIPEREDFDGNVLPNHFQWLRNPDPSTFMDLSARPGYLRLFGKQSLGNCFEQALIARRQQAFCFTATTCIDFVPSTFQQMAGLVCYYNGHKYHYLYVSSDQENGRHLSVMSCNGDVSMTAHFPLFDLEPVHNTIKLDDDSTVYLRARVDYSDLRFSWSLDGSTWQELGFLLDYSVISDEAGKGAGNSFTGAFVGVCCQDISGQDTLADFDFFEYVEH
jgi:xylan 1,4-beta-xylosidase